MMAHSSLSQTTSTITINNDSLYCLTQAQYNGLIKLYTDFQACEENQIDLQFKLVQSQTIYETLSIEFRNCMTNLDIVNEEKHAQYLMSLQLEAQVDQYKRQRNTWMIGGISGYAAILLTLFLIK